MKHKLKDEVETILRNVPDTRNSDICLMIEVWKHFYPEYIKKGSSGEEGVWLKNLFELPREDNVKRIRCKLNEEGKYFTTDWKVAQTRGMKEDEWRVLLGYPLKENTKNPTRSDSYMDTERSFISDKLQGKLL